MTILITLNTGDITYNRLYLKLILLVNDFILTLNKNIHVMLHLLLLYVKSL
jgi:hypothetical protein